MVCWMAHFAIRGLMHEAAALQADEDPDRLSSCTRSTLLQRRMPRYVAIPPQQRKVFHENHPARNPPGARQLQPQPNQPARREAQDEQLQLAAPSTGTYAPGRFP